VRPSLNVRANWAESFKAMAQKGDDTLQREYETSSNDWDHSGWEWK